jgi:superfamily II DNA or RNA helicase
MHGAGLLGLSATPGRKHHGTEGTADDALATLFGQHKVVLTIPGYASPVEGLISQGYLARLRHDPLQIAKYSTPQAELKKITERLAKSFDIDEEGLRVLGLDAMRNLQIVDKLESLVKDHGHRRIIAFAPSVVSSNLIANLLKARGIAAHSVHAGTPTTARDQIIAEYCSDSDTPTVLCNYGVLTAGFDAPRTSAVLIARPSTSIVLLSQMAGRALRGKRVGGNEEATLVTVADTSIPVLVDTVHQFHAFDAAWAPSVKSS